MIRSKVVFPQPDGPRSEKNSPRSDRQIDTVDGHGISELLGDLVDRDEAGITHTLRSFAAVGDRGSPQSLRDDHQDRGEGQ